MTRSLKSIPRNSGRAISTPLLKLSKSDLWNTRYVTSCAKASVASARYRSPSRRLNAATSRPMGTQMSAPARSASHTGHPESVASFAAVKAPIPASATCASESMPPSPMTTVKVRNSTASATPWLTTPTQKSLSQSGTEKSTSATANGPSAARQPVESRRGRDLGLGRSDPQVDLELLSSETLVREEEDEHHDERDARLEPRLERVGERRRGVREPVVRVLLGQALEQADEERAGEGERQASKAADDGRGERDDEQQRELHLAEADGRASAARPRWRRAHSRSSRRSR